MVDSHTSRGGALGAVPGQWQEAEKQALRQALLELPPVYVESADRGYGLCVVCGKKGYWVGAKGAAP